MGWWLIWSMSTARQRVWLEMRVVPLTWREWPLWTQEIRRVQWLAMTVSRDWMRRSSWGLARSGWGLQPWVVVGCRLGLWARAWVKGSGGGGVVGGGAGGGGAGVVGDLGGVGQAVGAEFGGGGGDGVLGLVDVGGGAVAVGVPGGGGAVADVELHGAGAAAEGVDAGVHAGGGGAAVVGFDLADAGQQLPGQCRAGVRGL